MKAWKFRSLMSSAQNGNMKAQNDLIEYVNSASKKTNRQMRALEKAGYDYYSYDIPASTLSYLGRSRFRETWSPASVEENWEEFSASAKAVYRFTEKERHTTPSNVAKYSSARLNFLLDTVQRAYGGEYDYSYLKNPSSESEIAQRKFLERAISSGAISDLVSAGYGMTGETIDKLLDAFEEGASVDEINNRVSPYLASLQEEGGYATIQDIWKLIK